MTVYFILLTGKHGTTYLTRVARAPRFARLPRLRRILRMAQIIVKRALRRYTAFSEHILRLFHIGAGKTSIYYHSLPFILPFFSSSVHAFFLRTLVQSSLRDRSSYLIFHHFLRR